MLGVQGDGTFFQTRTVEYAECAATHPHAPALHRLLAEANALRRFVKLGWADISQMDRAHSRFAA